MDWGEGGEWPWPIPTQLEGVSRPRFQEVWMTKLPEAVRGRVETRLSVYCEERIPDRVRHQVRLTYRIRGSSVTLIEQRPAMMDPDNWVDIVVAQFRLREEDSRWVLYWADRNSRWHEYDDLEPSTGLDDLLEEVDRDPTGIFWG